MLLKSKVRKKLIDEKRFGSEKFIEEYLYKCFFLCLQKLAVIFDENMRYLISLFLPLLLLTLPFAREIRNANKIIFIFFENLQNWFSLRRDFLNQSFKLKDVQSYIGSFFARESRLIWMRRRNVSSHYVLSVRLMHVSSASSALFILFSLSHPAKANHEERARNSFLGGYLSEAVR